MSASEPTIVVTGAAGFVGRALTAHLTIHGSSVISVSRRGIDGIHRVSDYAESPAGDVLVHLAEEPVRGVVNRLGEPYVTSSARLLRELCGGRYGRVIYASSGSVYGDDNEAPCSVNAPVIASDIYTKSKLTNEQIVLDAGGVVVRLSNLIGQGMSAHNVVSNILSQLSSPGAVRVRDDKPVRDFLGVTDAASALRLLIDSPFRGIINVGSGIGSSVRKIAEMLLEAAEQQSREIIATAPSSRRSMNVLDISATTSLLAWGPGPMEQQLQSLVGISNRH